METTDAQVRKLMREMQKHGAIGLAADRFGMDRKTARKYVRSGKLPSELKEPRSWRTRKSPIADEDSAWVEAQLSENPALEAKTLFEQLQERRPDDAYSDGVLRTLQRRVQWRATKGPEREVFFSQQHRPGAPRYHVPTHDVSAIVSSRNGPVQRDTSAGWSRPPGPAADG